ncbi:unnamed protein product [Cochlearia groenlandica]
MLLVVWNTSMALVYTKKGDITWRIMQVEIGLKYRQIICNRKDQKVYLYIDGYICVWDLSGDIPRSISAWRTADNCYPTNFKRINIATTISGDLLQIDCAGKRSKWRFHIHKFDFPNERWVKIDSLGDEALILDMGLTVVAKDIPWMKRNTVYFSGLGNTSNDCIFVYDLTTQTVERCLPQSIFTSMRFSYARWFLPGYNT